jgi:hypothetical protein
MSSIDTPLFIRNWTEDSTSFQFGGSMHPRETREIFHRFHPQQAKDKAGKTMLENKIPSTLPRSVFAANFGLITGHDYLQQHLNRIGIKVSLKCPLCNDRKNGP